jgi:hypothetical protein
MGTKKKILITAGGTGSGWRISKTVKQYFPGDAELIITDTNPRELVAAATIADAFFQVQPVNAPCYAENMYSLLQQEKIDAIIPLADMVVIARGDLGNAVPLWHLPYVQKEISAKCLEAGVPFMVVTQMLASMEKSPVPTRAEVSDIFNAVADGAASVMVTGETASGSYPLQVADYLVRTAREGLRYRKARS